jgi:hypothetical protein
MNWPAGRASRYMYIDEFTVRGFIDGCGGRTPQRVAFSRFASRRWHKQGTFQKGWLFKGLPKKESLHQESNQSLSEPSIRRSAPRKRERQYHWTSPEHYYQGLLWVDYVGLTATVTAHGQMRERRESRSENSLRVHCTLCLMLTSRACRLTERAT